MQLQPQPQHAAALALRAHIKHQYLKYNTNSNVFLFLYAFLFSAHSAPHSEPITIARQQALGARQTHITLFGVVGLLATATRLDCWFDWIGRIELVTVAVALIIVTVSRHVTGHMRCMAIGNAYTNTDTATAIPHSTLGLCNIAYLCSAALHMNKQFLNLSRFLWFSFDYILHPYHGFHYSIRIFWMVCMQHSCMQHYYLYNAHNCAVKSFLKLFCCNLLAFQNTAKTLSAVS